MTQINLDDAYAIALERWNNPHPDFTSGFDKRTSDNALLVHMYGGLQHAADHEWLNAGRRLIDKTYISMLGIARSLPPMPATPAERISASLDNYIQDTIKHQWLQLNGMPEVEKNAVAHQWLKETTNTLFGSGPNQEAASQLLFFLFPMLPIFCWSNERQTALAEMGYPCDSASYEDFCKTSTAAFDELKPQLDKLPKPTARYGSSKEIELAQGCLENSDWWQRRVFDEVLTQHSLKKD